MVCARRNAFNICLIDRNIPGGTVPGTVRMAVRLSVHLPVSLCLPPAQILPALLAAGYVAPYGATFIRWGCCCCCCCCLSCCHNVAANEWVSEYSEANDWRHTNAQKAFASLEGDDNVFTIHLQDVQLGNCYAGGFPSPPPSLHHVLPICNVGNFKMANQSNISLALLHTERPLAQQQQQRLPCSLAKFSIRLIVSC